MPSVKSSAVRSRPASASPGIGAPPKPPATASGAARTRSGTPAHAMSAPAAPPPPRAAAPRSPASAPGRLVRAPSARRTARSRRRSSARTVNRLATFAHAIRNTIADRAEQNPQRRRDLADKLFAQRLHHRPVALHDPHVGRGAAQPLLHAPRERLELRHQRGAVRSRLHACDRARTEPARRDLRGASSSGTQNATRSSGNRNSGCMMPMTVRFPPAKK